MNQKTFGEKLKELRNRNKLSQAKLAEMLGIGQNSIARYENNDREPSYNILIKISKIFQVPTDFLLGISNINTTNKYNFERYFQVLSTSYLSDEIEENFSDERVIRSIYGLVSEFWENTFISSALEVDILYMTNNFFSYLKELSELNNDDMEKEIFLEAYKEFKKNLDKYTSIIFDKNFCDFKREEIYFIEEVLKYENFNFGHWEDL